jgi:hypothetical protein
LEAENGIGHTRGQVKLAHIVIDHRILLMPSESTQSFYSLTADDLAGLERQRAFVATAAAQLGLVVSLQGDLEDLATLQAVLDAQIIGSEETWKLQSLGIVLGDVFEKHSELHWVIVEDEYGRDPALRFGTTGNLIFPLTMISKRVEDGEDVDVVDIYEGVLEYVNDFRESGS